MLISQLTNRSLRAALRQPAAAILLAVLLTSASAGAAELRIQLTGPGSPRELKDAVVSLHPLRSVAESPAATAVMEQRASAFMPRVLPVRVGTQVSFPNRDRIRHQAYSFSKAKTFELPLYSGSDAAPVEFDKPGIVVVGCNIHDSMIGYVIVLDTPHFARAGEDGSVVLNAPEGAYRMEVWHPRVKGAAFQKMVNLQAARSQELEVALEIPVTAEQDRAPERLRALRDKLRRMPRKP